ncbi:MAG: Wzz/FepE/Etk N-terminal domain-containing protein, partial [Bacteroidota bacterium]
MSNIKKESGKIDEKDQSIDFKAEFHKVISHWKIFSVSIIILLAISYLYTRYTTPVYKVECTILIKDESKSKSLASSTFVQELDIFKDQKKLENEIGILKSKYLSRKTVKDLGLYVTYLYKSKNLGRSIEAYENCPFYIDVDTSHLQVISTPIKISFSTDSTFEISIEKNTFVSLLNFKTQKTFYNTIPANISKKLKYNDTFDTDFVKFKILRRNTVDSSSIETANSKIDATDFTVTISNPLETGKTFSENISVTTIN